MKTKSNHPSSQQKVVAVLLCQSSKPDAEERSILEKQMTAINQIIKTHDLEFAGAITLVKKERNMHENRDFLSVLSAIESGDISGVVCDNIHRHLRGNNNLALTTALEVFIRNKAKMYTGEKIYDFAKKQGVYRYIASVLTAD